SAAAAAPAAAPPDLAQGRHRVVEAHRAQGSVVAGTQRHTLAAVVAVRTQLPGAAAYGDGRRAVVEADAAEVCLRLVRGIRRTAEVLVLIQDDVLRRRRACGGSHY